MGWNRGARHRPSRQAWLPVGVAAVACALVVTGAMLVTSRHGVPAADHARPASSPPPPVPPLTVVSATPADGATGVAPDATLTVQFSHAIAPGSATPALQPAVPGTWARSSPDTMTFTPSASLPPGTAISVVVPGGPLGVQATDGTRLAASVADRFTVAPMTTMRLQQLLALQGYLPVAFMPQSSAPVPPAQLALAQPGGFLWRWTTLPAAITSQWVPGQYGVITRGAVMSFEDQHGLATDGIAGPLVWSALLAAAAQGQTNPYGHWDWVDVTTALPETVHVWRDGTMVYQSVANTGVPGAVTTPGTFPVYLRYRVTTMSGTNPNGTTYHDTGIPWVSYFDGGDALHGFVRARYGFPQSDGCVEMPPANAAVVWPYTPIGTLVTVQ